MLNKRRAAWIGVGLLTFVAGLGVAWVSLSTPVVPAVVSQVSEPVAFDDADVVQAAVRAGKPTVAEFGANACASCRDMKVVLDALRQTEGERITIVNVDLLARKELNYIQRYRIQLMPTQVFFDAQGREIGRHMGKISAAGIVVRLQLPAPAGGPQ